MAEAMVGGAFLSAFLDVVFDRLASPEVLNLVRGKKLDPKLLQRLKTTLTVVRAVLNDAEKKQIRDSNVNSWLDDLKDAVYVADDLLDEISTKAKTQKEASNPISRLFNMQDREMVGKLENIVERLEYILKLKESLDLKEISAVETLSYRNPSTSLQGGTRVYGRDEDKKAIIKLLLDDNKDGEEVSVISIVGMGGVGKTTLAKSVYNDDDDLKGIFDFKAWVCVSEEFDILRITKIITQAVTKRACELDDLNLLHLDLQDKLKDKKFLVVLDDVWIEDYVKWDLLKQPFQRGVRGSKILVTTRSQKVASVLQTVQTYNLNRLSNEDCWLVFANHACFSPGSSGNSAALEKIGREIVKKCKGLPLAAQSLGGILRRKHDIRDWNNLLKSEIWELSESESKIIPALRVSYHYLPPNLKRCFVYCSLYPKDYEFVKDELILLWMAEDLLPPSKGKTLEEVGCECFDYLVSRSFLQRTWSGSFVIHDLLHDLATFLGGEFYCRTEKLGKEANISIRTRHLSFTNLENTEVFETVKFLRTFLHFGQISSGQKSCMLMLMSKLKHLRVLSYCKLWDLDALPDSIGELIHLRYLDLSRTSITALPESLCDLYNLQTLKLSRCGKLTLLPDSMQNLVNLLYLDLSWTSITALPESLCDLYNLQTLKLSRCGKLTVLPDSMQNLVNLLYLDLCETSITALPESLCDLYNLQTLRLCNCRKLTMLPSGMQNLVNLCYLDIYGTTIKEMPKVMGKLTQLQHLSNYIVGRHEENGIKELGGLSNLHGSLSIEMLENVSNGDEALEAKIVDKKSIDDLCLTWSSADYDCMNSQTEMDILCNLQPHRDLQYLVIKGYRGTRFPDWVGNSSYHNMTSLTLSSCKNCCMLPSLGQLPSLKHLRISYMDALVTIDAGFYNNNNDFSLLTTPFPLLESLVFFDMPCWEVWCPIEPFAFPKLEDLEIRNCPKLRDLPSHLPGLKYLRIANSSDALTSFPLDTYPNLVILTLVNCENLESLPEGGMPPRLRCIRITDCEKLLSDPAWPSMDMLTDVAIGGPCDGIKSFPKEGLLPSFLTSLHIRGFSSLETLDCKGLLHLTSLQRLTIERCSKLEDMAGERLPASLSKLRINKCPLLEEQCSMKHPQIWSKISHVHDIMVNWRSIR